MNWIESLQFAATHGLAAIEIRCLGGKVMEPERFETLVPPVSQAKTDLATNHLRLGMLGTSVKLLDRTEGEIETLGKFAQLADSLDCPWLRIFDGGKPGHQTTARIAETTAFLHAWTRFRAEHKIKCDLAVETHDAMADLATTKHLLEALPDFSVLWDTHHTWRFGESLTAYHATIKDRVVHYHAKDSADRPSPRKPFTYVEPGTGEFPWDELNQLLLQKSPDSLVSFEWEKHWNPELAPIESVITSFKRVLGQN